MDRCIWRPGSCILCLAVDLAYQSSRSAGSNSPVSCHASCHNMSAQTILDICMTSSPASLSWSCSNWQILICSQHAAFWAQVQLSVLPRARGRHDDPKKHPEDAQPSSRTLLASPPIAGLALGFRPASLGTVSKAFGRGGGREPRCSASGSTLPSMVTGMTACV